MPAEKTLRDQLRASTLGRSTRKSKVVTIETEDGPADFEIRSPSILAKQRAQDAGRIEQETIDGKTSVKIGATEIYLVELMLECVYVPKTGQKFFEEADRKVLLEESMTGWLIELAQATATVQKELAEAAPKGSAPTSGGSRSASSASVSTEPLPSSTT